MRGLKGPWTWQAKRRPYVGTVVVVVAVAVVALLVTRGGSGGSTLLLQEEPTPTSTEVTPQPTASTAVSQSTAVAPGPSEPQPSATTTPPSPAPKPTLDADHLLSSAYVRAAFAQDRTPEIRDAVAGLEALLPCQGYEPGRSDVPAARIWSWPDEIVVEEMLKRFDSAEPASRELQACHDAARYTYGAVEISDRTLDVGAGGYLVRRSGALSDEVEAGARVGNVLVLVTWRQSGSIGADGPLESALRAAVAKVLGDGEQPAEAAPAQRTPDELRGFLRHSTLPPSTEDRGAVVWHDDVVSDAYLRCQEGVSLAAAQPAVNRSWRGGAGNGEDFLGVTETVAHEQDVTEAQDDFMRCRESYGSGPIPVDVGDDAFLISSTGDDEHQVIYARVGATFVVITCQFENPEPVAQAAVTSLRAAGRLS
ncbi:MAG: hypothetical protein M3P04_12260 [Actinomycetota bacterium]|nr:hypothetical protein [Actinomycetota bacterium]